MAITGLYVSLDPNGLPSVNDNVWIMATSDLSMSINYRYVVDIYIGTTQLIRARVFPDPVNGACYFDAGSILRNQINMEWFYSIGNDIDSCYVKELSSINGEAAIEFIVYVGEEYYSGIDLVNDLQQMSYTQKVWNFVPPVFGRMLSGPDLTTFTGLTLSKRNQLIPGYGNLKFYNPIKYIKGSIEPLLIGMAGTDNGTTITINVYNSAGTLLGTDDFPLTFSESFTLQQLNISPKAINNSAGSTLINDSVADYYDIVIDDNGSKSYITVQLECKKEGTDPVHIHFMNSYGVFETAIFDLVNKKFANMTRSGYDKKEVVLGENDNPFIIKYYNDIYANNKVQYERRVNFNTEANYTMKLEMNFPTDNDWEWLSDLVSSPQIFLSNGIGAGYNGSVFYPVTIRTDNYEYFQRKYAKLKTFELEIDLNQKRNFYRR